MIEICEVDFKGIVSYREGKYDFTNNCGFVVVSGINRDSLISREQNNGAGKSVFFGMIPNVRFEKTPLADTVKKARIHSKGSYVDLTVKNLGHKWGINQKANGYVIERDGEDLKVRGQATQKAKVAEIIPLTEDEWYSYVYLQSQKTLGFQQSTPRVRMSYITDVWRLDEYDIMRKHFEKEVDGVKVAKNEYDVHVSTSVQLSGALKKNGWNNKKEAELNEATDIVKGLSKKVKNLQTRMQELRSLKKQVEFYETTSKALRKLEKRSFYTKAELKEMYKLAEQHEHYIEQKAEYDEQLAKLNKRLKALGKIKGAKALKVRAKELRKELEKWEEEFARLTKVRDKHDDAKRELENLDDHTEPELRPYLTKCNKAKLDPMEALKEEMGMVKTTLKLADLLHEHEDGKCPTCQSKINVKDLESSLKTAKKRKSLLASMIYALEIRNTRTANKAIVDSLKFDERGYYALKKKIKVAHEELNEISDQIEAATKFDNLTEQLAELKEPKAPKGKSKLSIEDIEAAVENLNEIKSLKARLAEFEDVPEDHGIAAELKEVDKKLNKLEKKYEKAFSTTVKLGQAQAEFKLLTKQRKALDEQIDKLLPLTQKLSLFKTLAKAYSNKGLKLYAMNNILYQLQQHYNEYASLIFAEPFKFTVMAKEDGVHILVDRGHGNPSDVRELSGAESDSFRLLHFLACVIMAPDERRMNIAILDEPDSHMDMATAGILFAERYIPFLRTLVPHIFLITQKGKHMHSNCDYLTIEKKNGISKLKVGQ